MSVEDLINLGYDREAVESAPVTHKSRMICLRSSVSWT